MDAPNRDPLRFALPADRIATAPIEHRGGRRDDALLLVASRSDRTLAHTAMRHLSEHLAPGDLLVANDSATVPAALDATDGRVVHVSTRRGERDWVVELRTPCGAGTLPHHSASEGEVVELVGGGRIRLRRAVSTVPAGVRLWRAAVELDGPALDHLHRHGRPIRYGCTERSWPLEAYQTAFARRPGSAEMPSAGRGFTPELLAALTAAGVRLATITLHCGVSSPESGEAPYAEWFAVPPSTAAAVAATRAAGRRTIAVGTTVVRALESAATDGGAVRPVSGWTELVLDGRRPAAVVDGILTGWHEPEASHLDLLQAVSDRETLARSYRAALAGTYRWHEFGDFHLLLP